MEVKFQIFGILDNGDMPEERFGACEIVRPLSLFKLTKAPYLKEERSGLTFLMYLDYLISYDLCKPGSMLTIKVIGNYLKCHHQSIFFRARIDDEFMRYLFETFSFDYDCQFKVHVCWLWLLTAVNKKDGSLSLRYEYVKQGILKMSSDTLQQKLGSSQTFCRRFGEKIIALSTSKIVRRFV